MKKSIVLLLASILMLSAACEQEQPTKFAAVYDKHTIQEDTNWVEITDIDTVDVCLYYLIFENGLQIQDEIQFKDKFKQNTEHLIGQLDSIKSPCFFHYLKPDINFELRDLIMFYTMTGPIEKTERQIFYNNNSNEYLYVLKIFSKYSKDSVIPNRGDGYIDEITIPKKELTVIHFDTLWVWK